MRYAVITDIHSNLEALEAVKAAISPLRADAILCLGDLVGYNADPLACVAALRDTEAIVRGNHDKAVAGLMNIRYFNRNAAEAVRWTTRILDKEALGYLRALKEGPRAAGDGLVLCHGSPQDEDLYLMRRDLIEESFAFLADSHPQAKICFFGHTHVPLAIDNELNLLNTEGTVELRNDRVYLINPGSVGQPRDGNPAAAFVLYDASTGRLEFHRVPYALGETQGKIIKAGLPPVLAQRLALGR